MRGRGRVRGLTIVRPLLGVRRVALRDYARSRGLTWGEDSTNDDISLSRNRLRRRLLADLQQINPGAVDNVARAATLMRDEEEWLDELATRALEEVLQGEEYPGGVAIDAAGLAALPLPLRRRVARLPQSAPVVAGHPVPGWPVGNRTKVSTAKGTAGRSERATDACGSSDQGTGTVYSRSPVRGQVLKVNILDSTANVSF